MHPDIQRAIELIDMKITRLQMAKQALNDEFGDGTEQRERTIPPLASPKRSVSGKVTRKQAIIQLLKKEPLSRKEIMERSGAPQGTVAFILKNKETFENREGKWRVRGHHYLPSQEEDMSSAQEAETP